MIASPNLKKAAAGQKILIDSNIIIYLTDSINPYQDPARLLFQMVEAGDVVAVVSILSVAEVMQGPIKRHQHAVALEVKDYLMNFPNCHCQEITRDVLDLIGNDDRIQWKGLRIVDSLIIASGLVNGVDLFVSNDRHFRKTIPQPMMLSFD